MGNFLKAVIKEYLVLYCYVYHHFKHFEFYHLECYARLRLLFHTEKDTKHLNEISKHGSAEKTELLR